MATQENINTLSSKLTDVLQTLKECELLAVEEIKKIERLKEEKHSLTVQVEKLKKALEQQDILSQEAENIPASKRRTTLAEIKKKEVKTDKTIPPQALDTLGDKFQGRRSINDTIIKSDIATTGTKITDITKAIGISDRFLFIKEIFAGDADTFALAINKLNALSNIEEAIAYLRTTRTEWNPESQATQLFLSIIRRRYL